MPEEGLNRPLVGVGVFVLRDGKFLMGWRKASHGANTWTLPGGHVEFGETLEQTAIREVKEETGLDIENIRFGALTNDIFEKEGKHYLTVWMLSDWKSGEPVIMEPDKYVDQQWFDLDSLPSPLFLTWKQLKNSEFIQPIRNALNATK